MSKARRFLEELNTTDEHVGIEAKQCTTKIDKSVLESICAFSNEPNLGGGTILIGVSESDDEETPYYISGVVLPDKLQSDLSTQCANAFNHSIRPLIEIERIDGKNVLIVTVKELDPKNKPLYFKSKQLPQGAWRRIGSTDQQCTDDDLLQLYHDADDFDKALAEGADLDDIDENAVRLYRNLRRNVNPKAEELNYSDFDLLRSLNAIARSNNGEWKLTHTGLLVFGTQMALRREMPAARVDYIRVEGTEWISDPRNRFSSIDMRGSLLLMVNRAFNAIADDLPRGFSLRPGNLQAERPLQIPEDALREAIVNALIHQNFRIHQPIQLIRYSNRIEIINPGFSLKPVETLGEPGSRMRNPNIGSIFHETQLAEAKGTGIGTMRRLMEEAKMLPPTFDSNTLRNNFTTRILLHHFLPESDLKWLASLSSEDKFTYAQKLAFIFLREVGAIDNITYRQLSDVNNRVATKELKMLVKSGFIDAKGRGRQTYYIPTEKLKKLYNTDNTCTDANGVTSTSNGASPGANDATSSSNDGTSEANNGTSSPNDGTSEANNGTSSRNGGTSEANNGTPNGLNIPEYLKDRIRKFGKRVPKAALMDTIVELCGIQPFTGEELATLLSRSESHIKNKIIPELLESKRIRFSIPEMKHHPNQKYTS